MTHSNRTFLSKFLSKLRDFMVDVSKDALAQVACALILLCVPLIVTLLYYGEIPRIDWVKAPASGSPRIDLAQPQAIQFDFPGEAFFQREDWKYEHDSSLPGTVTPRGRNCLIQMPKAATSPELSKSVRAIANYQWVVALDLTGCRNVDRDVLRELARCNHVMDIRIGDCPQITDADLWYLRDMQNLRQLALYRNTKITDSGVDRVIRTNESLEAIGLNGTAVSLSFMKRIYKAYNGKIHIDHEVFKPDRSSLTLSN